MDDAQKYGKVRASQFGDPVYTHAHSMGTDKALILAGIEDPNPTITRINSGGLIGNLAETIYGDFWHSGRRREGFTLRPLCSFLKTE